MGSADDFDKYVDSYIGSLSDATNDVHFQQILRFVDQRLSDSEAAFNLYERILAGCNERDEQSVVYAELKLSGLVSGTLTVSLLCEIGFTTECLTTAG